jgi:cyclophilin family peptidyl-prolyl cis-trans isomerase
MKKVIVISTFMLLFSVTGVLAQKDSNTKGTKAAGTEKPDKKANSNPMVLISTSMGDMKVMLYNATPLHRDNFLKLVREKFYDSLLFHRIIPNFMIQGGDPLSKNAAPGVPLGMGENGYTVPAEFVDTIFHKKGSLCAARTENPAKASSGCQFYIVQGQVLNNETINMMEMQRVMKLSEKQKQLYTTVGGTPWLDGAYTVYGEVVEGMDVIDKIAAVKTAPGDRPVENVYILKMTELK